MYHILDTLRNLSSKSTATLNFYDNKHEAFFTDLVSIVPHVKEMLDIDDATISSMPEASFTLANYVARKKSTVRKKSNSSTEEKNQLHSEAEKQGESTMQTNSLDSQEEMDVFENSNPKKSDMHSNSDSTDAQEPLSSKKNESCVVGTPGSVKLLAPTKASKHRKRRSSYSINSIAAAAPSSSGKKLAPCVTSNGQQSSKMKISQTTSENDDATTKKLTILKLKVEEQKKKRELKVEKNLLARQQLAKEREISVKKILEKTTEMKAELSSKKMELDSNKKKKLSNDPIHENEKTLAVESSKMLQCLPSQKENLNSTYVCDNENAHTQNKTFIVDDDGDEKDVSYTDYEISLLKSSDDEDDSNEPTKPVPKWATGLRLKQVLLKQFYAAPNVVELFGKIEIAPDETFGIQEKIRMPSRNSSAVWATPDQSFLLF